MKQTRNDRASKLDRVHPLKPAFARGQANDVSHADISTREERRRAFFERRGVPMPAPRPSWAHEQDRKSFNADWQAEQQAHQPQGQSHSASQAKAIPRPTVERDTSREAFKAVRRQQSQTRGMERGFDQGARRTSFARTIDL